MSAQPPLEECRLLERLAAEAQRPPPQARLLLAAAFVCGLTLGSLASCIAGIDRTRAEFQRMRNECENLLER